MNAFQTTALALAATCFAAQASAGLILTGVIDGPLAGGTPKAAELVSVGVTDLSQYAIGSANNGGGTDGPEFVLSGTAADGEFLYVASEEIGFTSFFGFAPTLVSGALSVNGDDAIELFFDPTGLFAGDEVVVDVFGDINLDGTGQVWDYADSYAYRVSETGPDGSTFVTENWTFFAPDTLDGTTSAAGLPFGTFTAVPEPASLALLALGGIALMGRRRSA